jgi:hypothetical protein
MSIGTVLHCNTRCHSHALEIPEVFRSPYTNPVHFRHMYKNLIFCEHICRQKEIHSNKLWILSLYLQGVEFYY